MISILALQPDARQIGYASFEGKTLIDWGAKDLGALPVSERLLEAAIPFFRTLIKWHEPEVVVVPPPTKTPGTFRNLFLYAVQRETGHIPFIIQSFDRAKIQETFKSTLGCDGVNKDLIMQALAKWFRELEIYLPKPRRPWQSEDYWAPMFDAVSLAVTYLKDNE